MKLRFSIYFLLFYSFVFSQSGTGMTITDPGGNTSSTFSCASPIPSKFDLTAKTPGLRYATNYTVKKNLTYVPYNFTDGTKQNINSNGKNFRFVPLDIGFNFCFYNNTYSQLAVGSSGMVTFDLNYLQPNNNFIFYKFNYPIPSSAVPPLNAIFGAYQEGLYFDDQNGSDIYTNLVGTAPFRKLVITYYNGVRIYDNNTCSPIRSTTQIVLSETTNNIDVYVADIPNPNTCANSPYINSVIGIQSSDAALGVSPPNRNTGNWEAHNEAYTFSPAGNIITPTIVWYNSLGKQIGTGSQYSTTITGSEVYTAVATYKACNADFTLQDDYPITVDTNYALAVDVTDVACADIYTKTFYDLRTKVTNQDPNDFDFYFYDSNGVLQNINSIPTIGELYTVKINSKLFPACTSSSHLQIVGTKIKSPAHLCTDMVGDIPVKNFDYLIVDSNYTGTITYYLASNPNQPITYINHKVTDTQTDFLVQLENCEKVPFTIKWDPSQSSTAVRGNVYFCYSSFADPKPNPYVVSDLTTNPAYAAAMKSTAQHYFFLTEDEASKPINKVDYTKAVTSVNLVPNGNYSSTILYVRFVDGDCFTVVPLYLYLVDVKLITNTDAITCDTLNDGSEPILLTNIRGTDLYSHFFGNQYLKVKYFSDPGYTNEITNKYFNVTTSGPNKVYVEMTFTEKTIDGSDCVTRDVINFTLAGTPVVSSPIDITLTNICDHHANGYEIFDATLNESQIISNHTQYIFDYFTSYDATTNTFNGYIRAPQYIKVFENVPKTIYVRVLNNQGCYAKVEIRYNITLAPNAIKLKSAELTECSPSAVASFNLDQAMPQMFDQSINTIPYSDIKQPITYYSDFNYNDETPYNQISSIYSSYKRVVYAKYEASDGCYSVIPIQLYVYPVPQGKSLTKNYCQYVGVKLVDYQNQDLFMAGTYDPTAPYIFTFYDKDPTVFSDTKVLDPNVVFYPQNSTVPNEVWFKISIKSINNSQNCSSYGKISFLQDPPVPVNYPGNIGENVCDTGNDLIETITLRDREADIKTQYPDATFTYYKSFPDSPISNPDTYAADLNKQNYVWLLVSTSAGCPALLKMNISFKRTPIFIVNSPLNFCQATESVVISPNYDENLLLGLTITNYDWTLPDGSHVTGETFLDNINTPGTYHLKITADNGCTYEKDIELVARPTPKIYKIVVEEYTVKVLATHDNNISNTIYYNMDGGAWQESYIFNNVSPGVHEFAVRYDVSDCPSFPEKALVLAGNNVVTPNGDGLNDKFVIKDLDIFTEKTSIQIFDRYKKLLFEQTTNTRIEWDAIFLYRPVPTGTYWYILKVGDGREISGWIFVKNRD